MHCCNQTMLTHCLGFFQLWSEFARIADKPGIREECNSRWNKVLAATRGKVATRAESAEAFTGTLNCVSPLTLGKFVITIGINHKMHRLFSASPLLLTKRRSMSLIWIMSLTLTQPGGVFFDPPPKVFPG